ncbi:MAG: response regulator [Hyphomicrobiales bacterium]
MVIRSAQRSFLLLAATLALPLVVFVASTVYTALENDRYQVERESLERARLIDALADSRIRADLTAMRVLATAGGMFSGDWKSAHERAKSLVQDQVGWRFAVISDLAAGEERFGTDRSFSGPVPIRAGIPSSAPPEGWAVGDMMREGNGCPCLFLHLRVTADARGGGPYLLSVGLDPKVFQDIMMENAPEGTVSAIVDRKGNFIGRSIDYEDRLGTPATEYVRGAVEQGGEGYYDGRTYEGFVNYTAYHTSALTGWSSHIAADSTLLDRPRFYSSITLVLATLLVLGAAVGLFIHARRDLEERRQAEQMVIQTQKLEALGRLTGGVAHDFNNLLTVIVGGLDLLLKREMDTKARRLATHALEAAHRGERLVRQLLAFSRGQVIQIGPVDLRVIFANLETLLARTLGSRMQLHIGIDPAVRWVTSDADQLELAIVNLALNARDAMPDGGSLTISAWPHSALARSVEIVVRDTGVGMTPEVAERAMEPFFTTKPKGQGTGLGLPQVFGITRQSGGDMDIRSVPGKGTSIILTLPVADAPAEQAGAGSGVLPKGRRRVLVVDDDEKVRGTMAEVLRDAGHVVVHARDGTAALEMLRKSRPDLLLTDYSMPGMTGAELARRARDIWDDLPVVIVSGYADAATLSREAPRTTLLSKPFTPRKLVEAANAALRRPYAG